MHKKKLFVSALLTVVGMALMTPSLKAATLNYNSGDLFLAFRVETDPGSTKDYLVNIGAASTYRDAVAPIVLNIGTIASDLATFSGPGVTWNTRSDLWWSISGGTYLSAVNNDPAKTLYATKAETVVGTTEIPWDRQSANLQALAASKFASLGSAYKATNGVSNTSTANSTVGYLQNANDTNSYASFQTDGASFSYFSGGIEGNFANGASGAVLDLYRMTPGSGQGELLGKFTITSGGIVTFTPVPEPSTALLLGGGLFVALAFFRRKRQLA